MPVGCRLAHPEPELAVFAYAEGQRGEAGQEGAALERGITGERSIARRAELLAEHDAWWAECRAIQDRDGVSSVDDADHQTTTALEGLAAIVSATAPMTSTATAGIVDDVIASAERGRVLS